MAGSLLGIKPTAYHYEKAVVACSPANKILSVAIGYGYFYHADRRPKGQPFPPIPR